MGRTYLRKTKRGADGGRYTSESLAKAIEDVKNQKRTIKGASKAYNIPRTTLRRHLRSQIKGRPESEGSGGGRSTDLSFEEEKRLADCLKTLEKWGFGLTRYEVLDLVQIYVTANKLKTRFKDNKPGEEWYLAFAKRHRLSLKKPQGVEYTRMDQINPFVIYSYFDQLEEAVKTLHLQDKPCQIFNLDESSFCHDPSKAKVVGAKGVKSTRMISSPGRENTSILICCSATGEKIPPLVIFKGKNILEHWLNVNEYDKTFYAASQKGWMETTIFSKWFKQCFLPNSPKERPLLLIYDGHATQVSIDLIEEALANQITILKLPPHTTHYLQPMDTAVFKSLKNNWEKELLVWQRQNPRQRIPKASFVTILNKVYDKLTADVIKNGFRVSGIFPLCRDVIPTDIFKPEDLKAYEQKKKAQLLKKKENKNTSTILDINEPCVSNMTDTLQSRESPNFSFVSDLNVDVNNIDIAENAFNTSSNPNLNKEPLDFDDFFDPSLNVDEIGPNDLNADTFSDQNLNVEAVPNSDDLNTDTFQNVHVEQIQTPSDLNPVILETPELEETSNQNSDKENSFESLLLKFIKGSNSSNNQTPKPKSRKRLCPNSEIITTKEYLDKRKAEEEEKKKTLEEKEKRKNVALERKQEKQKKQLLKNQKRVTSSLSEKEDTKKAHEEEEDQVCIAAIKRKEKKQEVLLLKKKRKMSSSSSESESDISMTEDESDDNEMDDIIEVLPNDFVIVSYESQYYPGQVMEIEPEHIVVKHMEKSGKLDGWKWPKREDILRYEKKEILKVIPPPAPINKRGVFKVPAMARFGFLQ